MIGIEILARAIKDDASTKASLYADDTTVFVLDLDSMTHLLSSCRTTHKDNNVSIQDYSQHSCY